MPIQEFKNNGHQPLQAGDTLTLRRAKTESSPVSQAPVSLKSVAAVVVTRDRLALLQRCLHALQEQSVALDAIYVIDVASKDGTKEFLQSCGSPFHVVRLETNAGGAGGFHAGLEAIYRDGYEWAWCMDDDGYPAPDALERLLDVTHSNDSRWLNSLVVSIENPDDLAFPFPVKGDYSIRKTEEVLRLGLCVEDSNPFNGTLIHRSVVENVGLPHPDFFIWGDEQEYKRRAAAAGVRILTITNSIFHHPASSSVPLPIVPLKSFWKYYYHVRNHGATATKEGHLRLSPSGAFRLGKEYGIWLLKSTASNAIKLLIITAAILAAVFNNTRRYYP
jgi:rhamnopyranosyl-N-acetylglucosaminyl-diphospho-decaprenol beta-1,3/1,4-galactofuranosyltransferase